jgi:hypothetical protein
LKKRDASNQPVETLLRVRSCHSRAGLKNPTNCHPTADYQYQSCTIGWKCRRSSAFP